MSFTIKLILFAAFIFLMLIMSANYRKRKKRIIFFGDSITESGALFGGYIQRLAMYLQDEDIADKYELVGMGKGGNKVTDLLHRIDRDILERGADLVIVFIGVNDVWHRYKYNAGTDERSFFNDYTGIAEKLKSASIKTMMCTPAVIGEASAEQDQANIDLDAISDIIRQIAASYEFPLIDLRSAFKKYLAENNTENMSTGILTKDGVHLNDKGNQLAAMEMWKVLKEEFFAGHK